MAYDENIYARIISGELSDDEIAQLKSSGEWQEIQAILQATEGMTIAAHDKEKGFDALIKKRDVQASKGNGTKIRRLYLQLGSAAAVVLLLAAAYLLLSDSSIRTSAANGEMAELNLDGTIDVTLNDGSSLQYTETKENGERVVKLKGEAFFKVVPGNKLSVATAHGTVQVLGTEFNVRSWGDNFTVDCFEGKVAVTKGQQRDELKAKERMTFRRSGKGKKTTIADSRPGWMNGATRVHQESMSEVIEELERQYDVNIKHAPSLKTFSGEFVHSDLQKALEQICSPMGLKFKTSAEGEIEVYE